MELLRRRKARINLTDFTGFTYPAFESGFFHELLDRELERFYVGVQAGERPRTMIFAPPRHGKSEKFSRRFPAWAFGQNPDLEIIGCSYSSDLASRMNRDVQRIIDSEEYRVLFPEVTLNSSSVRTAACGYLRNSDMFEIVGHGGAYRSAGVGGGITGMGADVGIIDDPVKDAKEANSKTYRDSVFEWYNTTFQTRLSPRSGVLLGMTRWNVADLAGELLSTERERWRVVSFPAIAEADEYIYFDQSGDWRYDDESGSAVESRLLRRKGEALHSGRYPLDVLEEIKAGAPQSTWASLYQQSPIMKEGGLFSKEWFPKVDALPAGMKFCRRWDLASTKDGDWSAGVLMGVKDGKYIVVDVIKLRDTPARIEAAIKNTAAQDKDRYGLIRTVLPQDPGQAGVHQKEIYAKLLTGFDIRFERETGSKEDRARPFSAQCEVGNVSVMRADWNADFLDEISVFRSGAHDDQVDAASGAFNDLATTATFMPPSSQRPGYH